jgi:hypothetical protein
MYHNTLTISLKKGVLVYPHFFLLVGLTPKDFFKAYCNYNIPLKRVNRQETGVDISV